MVKFQAELVNLIAQHQDVEELKGLPTFLAAVIICDILKAVKPGVQALTQLHTLVEQGKMGIVPPITTTGTPTRITWSIKTGTGTSTYPNGTVFIEE